jgi:hypothetical protein
MRRKTKRCSGKKLRSYKGVYSDFSVVLGMLGRLEHHWKSKLRPKTSAPFSVWGSDPSRRLAVKYCPRVGLLYCSTTVTGSLTSPKWAKNEG